VSDTLSPPEVLRLTGHPVRWRLLNELARSDLQVRELTALVGQKQSLTSYHLGQLRTGGLVTMRRSSADKRDTYYSLDLAACRTLLMQAGAALHPGLRLIPAAPPPPQVGSAPLRVLFLCTGNSSRSQMAEALLRHLAGPRAEAASAGSAPKPLHPDAIRVMHERGLDMSAHHPKHLGEFTGRRFDRVITLCDRVREVCPELPGAPETTHWSLPDPAAPDQGGYPAFVRTADDLTTRIRFLLHTLSV
jgi:protein-tyrosine-phosphatase/DNA-binding transcriptional ArsR family regulator